MNEKNFITSGRNTIIHKIRKTDLIILNGGAIPVIVSNKGIMPYTGEVPRKKADAKKNYMEVIDLGSIEIFGEEKKNYYSFKHWIIKNIKWITQNKERKVL